MASTTPLSLDSLANTPLQHILTARKQILRSVLAGAPASSNAVVHPPGTAITVLLEDVIKLWTLQVSNAELQNANTSTLPLSDADSLSKLLHMPATEVLRLGREEKAELVQLMEASLRADSSLEPKDFSSEYVIEAAVIAISWQLHVVSSRLPASSSGEIPEASGLPPLGGALDGAVALPDLLPGQGAVPENPVKRQRLSESGNQTYKPFPGVDQDFRRSLGGTYHLILPSDLPTEYPGRASCLPRLNVPELMGPTILTQLLQLGENVEAVVRSRRWDRTSTASEMEAVTLARMIHLKLLSYKTLQEALERDTSLEVVLRRLYAILKVEEEVTKYHVDRRTAWDSMDAILETQPASTLRSPALDSFLRQETNSHMKYMNTLRSMGSLRDSMHRNNTPQGGPRPHQRG